MHLGKKSLATISSVIECGKNFDKRKQFGSKLFRFEIFAFE